MEAIKSMKWVMVLTLLVLYAAAIFWTTVVTGGLLGFADGDDDEPSPATEFFGSVAKSLFSLFKLMNGDTEPVEHVTDTVAGQLLFAGFLVISNWAILAILTSVVSDNMMTASAKATEEDEAAQKELDSALQMKRLRMIFDEADTEGTGHIDEGQWSKALADPAVAADLMDATGLSTKSLQDIWDCTAKEDTGGAAPGDRPGRKYLVCEEFIEHLYDASNPADKRSIIKIMSRLNSLEGIVGRVGDLLEARESPPQAARRKGEEDDRQQSNGCVLDAL